MFEKEAEDNKPPYAYCCFDTNCGIWEDGFKKGAEFGYNKANEWHYVKDGDLPKDEDYKFCISSNGIYYIARYEELFVNWTNQEHKEVCCPYAWKEIVLPKEIKEK